MVNFGPLAAEIGLVFWGTTANFNGFRVLATLLHGTPVAGVSQTLPRCTEGATYIGQGDHDVGHSPNIVFNFFPHIISAVADLMSTILLHNIGVALVRI